MAHSWPPLAPKLVALSSHSGPTWMHFRLSQDWRSGWSIHILQEGIWIQWRKAVLALHVEPSLPTGCLASRAESFLAASSHFVQLLKEKVTCSSHTQDNSCIISFLSLQLLVLSTASLPESTDWKGVQKCSRTSSKEFVFASVTEEGHEKLYVSKNDYGCSSRRQIHDRDLVECLENDVKYWADFSKVQYHTRSLYKFSSSWIVQRCGNYGIGKDIFSGGLQVEEINERLRLIAEECDHI